MAGCCAARTATPATAATCSCRQRGRAVRLRQRGRPGGAGGGQRDRAALRRGRRHAVAARPRRASPRRSPPSTNCAASWAVRCTTSRCCWTCSASAWAAACSGHHRTTCCRGCRRSHRPAAGAHRRLRTGRRRAGRARRRLRGAGAPGLKVLHDLRCGRAGCARRWPRLTGPAPAPARPASQCRRCARRPAPPAGAAAADRALLQAEAAARVAFAGQQHLAEALAACETRRSVRAVARWLRRRTRRCGGRCRVRAPPRRPSSRHSSGTRRRSHSACSNSRAALLVADVARQHVRPAWCPCPGRA